MLSRSSDGDVGEITEMVHYCQINLTEKNIIAASRPQPLYKAGAEAENSHIDVQNLKTVLSL